MTSTMRDYFKGFSAELLAFVLVFVGNLSQVNMILETVLLSFGIISSIYGFYQFYKKHKK